MTIVEGASSKTRNIEDDNWIPPLFKKSGYQGYKIFIDRYTLKKPKGEMNIGDLAIIVTERHPKFPKKELGWISEIDEEGAIVDLAIGGRHYESFDLISIPSETTPEHVKSRVARALASVEDADKEGFWYHKFYDILLDDFIPGGRVLAGAGTPGLTLNNCYVIPSPKDSRSGILESVTEMVETHARGGGVGVNLSSLRPRYGYVAGVNGTSSGAVSWGKMWNLATGLVEQGGSRRGATMLMINDWHPDVFEFIHAKKTPGEFENANMSVCISDDFMRAVENNSNWDLIFPDTSHPAYDEEWNGILSEWKEKGYPIRVFETVKARDIWDQIITSAWENAEPGLHFLEHSNKESNSWYFAPLVATNPCGEQPLEEYGVCTLGAIDLSKFATDDGIDWFRLGMVVKIAVRFLDNVIDLNNYHFESIEKSHKSNRRIGLGHMGLGELLIRLGIRYGSDESVELVSKLQKFIATEAYVASVTLAAEKGAFPAFDAEKYLMSGFMNRMPEWLRGEIRDNGVRNVCILTQAPNGTTGTMMGTSTGIEPYFAFHYTRTSRLGVHEETVKVIEELKLDINNLPEYCITAQELSPMEHLKVQAALQEFVDSAISKTTNVPADWTVGQVQELYLKAWHMGCKGITIYRDGSRHEQVLTVVKNAQTQDNNCEVCGEVLIAVDGCVSCPNGCFSKCELY